MSKYVKIIVAVATAMIAAGVILAAVGLALGGLNSVHFGAQGFYVDSEPGFWGANESLSKRFDQFENIDIDVAAYTVRLRKGDAYGMELKSRRARARRIGGGERDFSKACCRSGLSASSTAIGTTP